MTACLIGLMAFLFVHCAGCLEIASAEQPLQTKGSAVERFLMDPSWSTWDPIEKEIQSGSLSGPNATLKHLLVFHRARLQRDLPNSMARLEVSPKDFVRQQETVAAQALEDLRHSEKSALWRVIGALMTLEDKEGLVESMSELAARLSPTRFEEFAKHATSVRPQNKELFDFIRDRWLRKGMGGMGSGVAC